MSAEPLACPYCNALVPLPPNAHDGQRVACPRCGEAFPLRGMGSIQAPAGEASSPTSAVAALNAPPPGSVPSARARNNRVPAVVLSLMALMAVTGLTYALLSRAERRAHDEGVVSHHKRPIFPEPPDPPTRPPDLKALRYLPSRPNVVLGVHVRQLRQSTAGLKLLSEPINMGKEHVKLVDLFSWTGLDINDLDHFVVGVRTENVSLPRVVVVARTSKKINRLDTIAALQAREREVTGGSRKGQKIYLFTIPNVAHDAKLWFVDDRTLVLDLFAGLSDAFDDVPEQPRDDLNHLAAVRSALKERIDAGAVLWLTAAVDDWGKMTSAVWFAAMMNWTGDRVQQYLDRLKMLRELAVSLQLDPDAKSQADFRCQNAEMANELCAAIVGPKGEAPPPGVTSFLDRDWLTVQWKGSLDGVFKALVK